MGPIFWTLLKILKFLHEKQVTSKQSGCGKYSCLLPRPNYTWTRDAQHLRPPALLGSNQGPWPDRHFAWGTKCFLTEYCLPPAAATLTGRHSMRTRF